MFFTKFFEFFVKKALFYDILALNCALFLVFFLIFRNDKRKILKKLQDCNL